MGLNRESVVRPNAAANLQASERKDIFFNLKPDSTTFVRFLPTTHPDGLLFYTTHQHFNFKDQTSDDPNKTQALACGLEHGDEDKCFICELAAALKATRKKTEKGYFDKIKTSVRYNAQIMVNEKQPDGSWRYTAPKILGLSGGLATDIGQMLVNMEMLEQPPFSDIAQGQDLVLTREGSGLKTRYKADRSSKITNLDEVKPGWDEDFIDDMWEALGLKEYSYEEQKEIAMFTFGDKLDWEALGLA